jgi:hypothetical protein
MKDYSAILDLAVEAKHDWQALIDADDDWKKNNKKKYKK